MRNGPCSRRPGAGKRYVVLNSGHTFRGTELASLNDLLFPRWGDWAVLKVVAPHSQSDTAMEEVLRAGYFNEQWGFPGSSARP